MEGKRNANGYRVGWNAERKASAYNNNNKKKKKKKKKKPKRF